MTRTGLTSSTDRSSLASALRAVARLMAEPEPSPAFRLLLLIAQVTTAAEALIGLADSTAATAPLAALLED